MSRERKSGGAGKVFLGMFLGFLLTLGAIIGLGCLVYFKGSISWLNKVGLKVDTGSDKLNEMTLNQIVKSSAKVIGNTDSMSLDDVAKEFGYNFKSELLGIDISDIKTAPISNLSQAVKEKFNNISAYEIEGAVDLTRIEGILSSVKTFYLKDGKLYTDEARSNEVNFKYEFNSVDNTVKIKNQTINIEDNSIKVETRYLPLTYAINDVNDSTVAEVLNYKYIDGKYYDSSNNEVSGILALVAPKKVGQLEEVLKGLTIGQVFGDSADLSNSIFSLIDVSKYEGVSSYADLKITDVPDALKESVKSAKINTLVEKGFLDLGSDYESVKEQIGDLTLSQVISKYITSLKTA